MSAIRLYEPADLPEVRRIHIQSGLPAACMPDLQNPNFVVKLVSEDRGEVTHAGFVKLTGEAFVLVDNKRGDAQERLAVLENLVARGLRDAANQKLDDVSAWLPPSLAGTFGKRLEALGWIRSSWPNWTALLR